MYVIQATSDFKLLSTAEKVLLHFSFLQKGKKGKKPNKAKKKKNSRGNALHFYSLHFLFKYYLFYFICI